jgi:hypothetical protein
MSQVSQKGFFILIFFRLQSQLTAFGRQFSATTGLELWHVVTRPLSMLNALRNTKKMAVAAG